MQDTRSQVERLNDWMYSFNANFSYNQFINATKTDKGLAKEIKKVFRIIDDIVLNTESEQFKKELKKGTQYYRARIIDLADEELNKKGIQVIEKDKLTGFDDFNSREPLIGIGGAGRNNIAGVSYLYVASNPETACTEIKPQLGDLISLATFELLEPLEIIDFASEKAFQKEETKLYNMSMGIFFTKLMFRFCEPVKDKSDYRATQIIADYLRKTGIDGIAYKSYQTPGGCNYTFFNSHPSKIKFCGSKILIHKQANYSFWDYNDETEIMSNKEGFMLTYEKEIADEQKDKLLNRFERMSQK